MKPKSLLVLLSVLVALIIITGACSAGFIAGQVLDTPTARSFVQAPSLPGLEEDSTAASPTQRTLSPQDRDQLFEPFWQAWDLVHEQYVDQPVDDDVLMQGAIRGMLEALGDQHTSYMDPETYTRINSQLHGEEYEGIGAWVDVQGEFLKIISPMPGSPAEKAGLKPGDAIIAVDGEDMIGVDGELVRQKVIGPRGSTVRLTISREGLDEPFDVLVTRASIVVPTVESKMLAGNVGYVRLFTFGEKTDDDLRAALKDLLAQKPAGLVLDLRYNGGGFLDTGIAVASEFIGDGVVMHEEYGDGSRDTKEARKGGLATDIPLVVLINEGSASASEIVAGAIQDRGRGQLVGVTSFGKGSVQVISQLKENNGAVRVTIARWLTPNGRTIHQLGLEPNVMVEITEEDVQAQRDPQLDKAVELLTQ